MDDFLRDLEKTPRLSAEKGKFLPPDVCREQEASGELPHDGKCMLSVAGRWI
jgi:hypothetical protein